MGGPFDAYDDDVPDDYIGIRYRLVRRKGGERRPVVDGLHGPSEAKEAMVTVAGVFTVTAATAAGIMPRGDGIIRMPVTMLYPGEDGEPVRDLDLIGLRIHTPDGPVDFLLEEDDCGPDTEEDDDALDEG